MTQDEIIRRLGAGEGFGQIPEQRIDTHISIVFLVGDEVYKLKRAVTTSYLDYATVEARHRFCQAEIDVNRRTAPQIYLGVVPVRESSDGMLVLGEAGGEAIEWLVHMRRFPQEALFDRLAGEGMLTATLLLALADEIAAFHASAEKVIDSDAGQRVAAVIDENAGEIQRHAGELVDRDAADAFGRRCRTVFEGVRHRIDRRGADGFLRHCHGDLHLRNICLIDGRPTLFDAIEFNDDISQIDVLFDLAFLLMDLEKRGLRSEANTVFNRYLYRTRDIDDLAVLPLYLALRAGIRIHTSAMGAASADDKGEKERLQNDAEDYLSLGRRLLDAGDTTLTAIGGLSGVGKSTVARRVAPRLGVSPGALVISSDLVRKRRMGAEPLTRLSEDAYSREIDDEVYDEMMNLAGRALAGGHAVILDGTFQDPRRRHEAEASARSAGVPFHGIWLETSPSQLYERLDRRAGDPSDATGAVLAQQLENDVGDLTWLRVDAGRSADEVAQAICDVISDARTGG